MSNEEFHAKASPSRLSRILNCPGSYRPASEYEEKNPQETSSYAEEGSMLHDIMQKHLEEYKNNPSDIITVNPALCGKIDGEQVIAIEDCIDYTNKVLMTLTPVKSSWSIFVEERVHLEHYHPILENTNGKSDLIVYDRTTKALHVFDWKFGQGEHVAALGNDQAKAYAAGAAVAIRNQFALDMNDMEPRDWVDTVHIHIVQPRLENFDILELIYDELYQWVFNRLVPRLIVANDYDAPKVPGYKQCRWCPLLVCDARVSEANNAARQVFAMAESLPPRGNVPVNEVAAFLGHARRLKDIIASMEDYVARSIRQGDQVEGWKMVSGRSTRKWKDAQKAEEFLMNHPLVDMEDIYTTKFVTPAQAEKISKKIKSDDTFHDLIFKSPGKPTLTTSLDSRAAISFDTPSDLFSKHLMEDE